MVDRLSREIVVVGAGPAGLAAAIAARAGGNSVTVVDDNPTLGGQIWRGLGGGNGTPQAQKWLARLETSGVERLLATQVVGTSGPRTLICERQGRRLEMSWDRLVLATGARELFLPFPGWTLPNIMGAGGMQAMVKSGLSVVGKRVIVAGSGPLLIAVAALLKQKGARVEQVVEQASFSAVARFSSSLWSWPGKLGQAVSLFRQLRGTPVKFGAWPIAADGGDRLRSVTLCNGQETWSVDCDYLACGFGLLPNVELAMLLGCRIESEVVAVDAFQETSLQNVFSAGEIGGIGGLETALIEGEIAGYAAADCKSKAQSHFKRRAKARAFSTRLQEAFALRKELKALAKEDTIICRCEDVKFSEVKLYTNALAAKLQTRCGMGPCQGRVCGPALEFMMGWSRGSLRPPVFPASVATLAGDFGESTPDLN